MSETSSDLKVRIVLNKPGNEKPNEEYQYLWGRIISVVLLLGAVIFAAIWILTDTSTSPDNQAGSAQTESLAPESRPQQQTAISHDQAPAQTSAPASDDTRLEKLPLTAQAKGAQSPKNQVPKNQSEPAPSPSNSQYSEATPKKTMTPGKPVVAEKNPAFTQIKTEIFSPLVKRFTVAKSIQDKEPKGDAATITLDNNNIATVYAFSQVTGLKDEFIHYVWKIDGKEIARVKIGVWNNDWRSYSRKYFNQTMHGNIAVELYHGKNTRLARITMIY